jgi:DNA-binding CsgD family transcriptional regulator
VDDSATPDVLDQIAAALDSGVLLVDPEGEVLWMDRKTRRRINGGLHQLDLPLRKDDGRVAIDCRLAAVEVQIDGKPQALNVIQIADRRDSEHTFRNVVFALEQVMLDSSWLTRTLADKLRAALQASQPTARDSDLDMLTARECEVLLLVCEGRGGAEMSRILNLSQNTVRNHLASLFRKIGVNRRSAAIIWARERAITRDALAARTRPHARARPRHARASGQPRAN